MAYDNFKPTIWSTKIQHEIEQKNIFQGLCNTKFSGEIGVGKRVKIIGAARPTVNTYSPGSDIATPETPADTSMFMDIDQYKYTNFIVDDIDEAQSMDGLMQAYMQGSAEALAENRDKYIAEVAGKNAGVNMTSSSTAVTTSALALSTLNTALDKLRKNGILDGVVVALSVDYARLLKTALMGTGGLTDNVDLVKKGNIAQYDGATIYQSNHIYNDATDDYILVMSKDAVSFAGGISSVEPYRPEKKFADAVKVLDTFGAKVVRPNEIYVIKAHYTSA